MESGQLTVMQDLLVVQEVEEELREQVGMVLQGKETRVGMVLVSRSKAIEPLFVWPTPVKAMVPFVELLMVSALSSEMSAPVPALEIERTAPEAEA